MDIRNIYHNGQYLRAHDLQNKPHTLTIAHCEIRNMAANGRGEDQKAVLRFVETEKEFACNKTNASKLSDALGWESDNWGGHGNRVTLSPSVTTYNGAEVPCIRVTEVHTGAAPAPSNGEVPAGEAVQGLDDSPIPF